MRLNVVETADAAMLDSLDTFMRGHPKGAVHQWQQWSYLNAPTKRQQYLHFIAHDDANQVVGGGLIRLNRFAMGYSMASLRRGPVTDTPARMSEILVLLEPELKRRGAIGLSINPSVLGEACSEWLTAANKSGYMRVTRDLQNLPTTTALVDLTRSEEEIFAGVGSRHRRDIRGSVKKGLSVRPVHSLEEAALLTVIMDEMAATTDMETDNQHRFEAHYEFLSQHPDRGAVLAVLRDGKIFGGSVNYIEGRVGYNLISATSPSMTGVPRAHLLMWETILAMKSKGCTAFDLVGYPDPALGKSENAKGRAHFKSGFNPDILQVFPIMSKPLNLLPYLAITKLRRLYRGSKYKNAIKSFFNR